MPNPCADCTIRQKIKAGCCVQDNHPEGTREKVIAQKKDGVVVRRLKVCENLDPTSGECASYPQIPEMCQAFTCERFG